MPTSDPARPSDAPEPVHTPPGTATAGAAAAEAAAVPAGEETGDLSFPATRLARDARELVQRDQEPYLRNHSLRSFLFARAAAERDGQRAGDDYDAELVFLICALHDVGLAGGSDSGELRFEVDGADFAARFMEERGVKDGRVDTVWDGIALHTTFGFRESPVYARRRPAEILIAQTGIGIDVLGGPGALPPGYADRVHAEYPRLGGARVLTDTIIRQARTSAAPGRKAPPTTFPGELLHQRHPSLPYTTWDEMLDMGGWND